MNREVFSGNTIESISNVSRRLESSFAALDKLSTAYDNQDLYNACHMSLKHLSYMFDYLEFNMRLINEIFLFIDKLPNAEEIRKAVETQKKDHKFIKWEQRLREDEVKEKEKSR